MEWVETTGRTVDEAKEAALDKLGIDALDAEFEVIEEPKTGLFGRVRGEARVRARVAPKAPRPKQERRNRRSGPKRPGDEGGAKPAKADTSPADDAPEPDADAEATPAPRRARSTSRSGSSASRESSDMNEEPVPVGQQADIITEFLEGLLGALGAEGKVVRTEVDDETIELSVEGDDLGPLIGPKGQTLTAVPSSSRARCSSVRRPAAMWAGSVSTSVATVTVGPRPSPGSCVSRPTRWWPRGCLEPWSR